MAGYLRLFGRQFSLMSRSAVRPIRGEIENAPGNVSNDKLFLMIVFLLEHAFSDKK